MIGMGEIAIATTDDNPVTVLAATPGLSLTHLAIINDGVIDGFFRVGTGPYLRLKAQATTVLDNFVWANMAVQVKRVAAGSNLTDLWAFAW